MRHALIAQLDRVFGYEPKGRGFESLSAHQKQTRKASAFFLLVPVRAQPKGLPGRRPETHLRCIFTLWKALTHGRNCAIILFAH